MLPCPAVAQVTPTRARAAPEAAMPRDREPDAEHDALGHVADAVMELLEQLQTTSDASERTAQGREFTTQVDGIRADLRARQGLADREAEAVLARALARVGDLVRAMTPCA